MKRVVKIKKIYIFFAKALDKTVITVYTVYIQMKGDA